LPVPAPIADRHSRPQASRPAIILTGVLTTRASSGARREVRSICSTREPHNASGDGRRAWRAGWAYRLATPYELAEKRGIMRPRSRGMGAAGVTSRRTWGRAGLSHARLASSGGRRRRLNAAQAKTNSQSRLASPRTLPCRVRSAGREPHRQAYRRGMTKTAKILVHTPGGSCSMGRNWVVKSEMSAHIPIIQ